MIVRKDGKSKGSLGKVRAGAGRAAPGKGMGGGMGKGGKMGGGKVTKAQVVEPIRSLGELAGLVDRNKSTVSRWIGRGDWPFGKAPWKRTQVPEILRWVAEELSPKGAGEKPEKPGAVGQGGAGGAGGARGVGGVKGRDEMGGAFGGDPLAAARAEEEGGGDDGSDGGGDGGGKRGAIQRLKEAKLRQEIRAIRARADTAETALARDRGALLDAAEVESSWAALGAQVRAGFANLASQLVPLALTHGMPHDAAAEYQKQVDDAINHILKLLSGDGTGRDGTPASEDGEGDEGEVGDGGGGSEQMADGGGGTAGDDDADGGAE